MVIWCGSHHQRKGFKLEVFIECSYWGTSPFPWKCIWKAGLPHRVSLFIWTAILWKILITDNLRKRAIIIVNLCCMRKSNGKSVHLLLHCPISRELWDMLLYLLWVTWVMPHFSLLCWSPGEVLWAVLKVESTYFREQGIIFATH